MKATAATADVTSAVEAISTMEAANGSACDWATTRKALSAANESWPSANETGAPIEAAAIESRPTIEAVEPRAGADEDAVRKPAWPVVAVRRARVWVIRIVAVSADGWTIRGDHSGSDSNTDSYSNLCLGSAGSHAGEGDEESDQCRIF